MRFARAFVGNIDRGVHFFHAEYAVIRIGLGGVITPLIGEIKPCPLVGRCNTDAILDVLLKVLQVGCHFRSNARILRVFRLPEMDSKQTIIRSFKTVFRLHPRVIIRLFSQQLPP